MQQQTPRRWHLCFLITWHNSPVFLFILYDYYCSMLFLLDHFITTRFQITPVHNHRNNKELVSHHCHTRLAYAQQHHAASLCSKNCCAWYDSRSVGRSALLDWNVQRGIIAWHWVSYRIVQQMSSPSKNTTSPSINYSMRSTRWPVVIQCAYTIIRTVIRHFYSVVSWKGFDFVVSCYTLQFCSPSYNNNNHSSSSSSSSSTV